MAVSTKGERRRGAWLLAVALIGSTACHKGGPGALYSVGDDAIAVTHGEGDQYFIGYREENGNHRLVTGTLSGNMLTVEDQPITMEFSADWSHATFQLSGKSMEAQLTTGKELHQANVGREMSEGEAGLKALFGAEKAFLARESSYPDSLAQAGFEPEACPDGSRAAVPDPSWVAGCNFVYSITFTGPATRERHFTGHARAVSGPAQGKALLIYSNDTSGVKAGEVHPE